MDKTIKKSIDNLYHYAFSYIEEEVRTLKFDNYNTRIVNDFRQEAIYTILIELDNLRQQKNHTITDLENANNLIYDLSVIAVKYEDMEV